MASQENSTEIVPDGDDDDDIEDDNSEALTDLEDEDLICSKYVEAPKHKVLPHAVVIGSRKGGTRKVTGSRFTIYFILPFNRALLEFININSRVRIAKSETHFYDNKFEKVSGEMKVGCDVADKIVPRELVGTLSRCPPCYLGRSRWRKLPAISTLPGWLRGSGWRTTGLGWCWSWGTRWTVWSVTTTSSGPATWTAAMTTRLSNTSSLLRTATSTSVTCRYRDLSTTII